MRTCLTAICEDYSEITRWNIHILMPQEAPKERLEGCSKRATGAWYALSALRGRFAAPQGEVGWVRFALSAIHRSGKGLMQGRQMARSLSSIALVALGVAAGAQAVEAQPAVTRVHGIATGIAACWRPPHDDDQVTVRVSFTRDGAVIGQPRIVFVQSSGGRADDATLAQSMVMAIRDCTPLHFSAQLGSAIAGQVLDIRFIGRSRATIVAPP